MMLDHFTIMSGVDIPLISAQIVIHQPTMKEIGYIGEDKFFTGCELLNFSKEKLTQEDKINLANKSNFEIFMSIMKDNKTPAIQHNRISAIMLLSLLFPEYNIGTQNNKLILEKENEESHFIDEKNFEAFKEILVSIFCLNVNKKDEQNYNPRGALAEKLAAQMRKGREKAAAAKGENIEKTSVFNKQISILVTGQQKTYEELMGYTIYQLRDEYERYQLKYAYEQTLKARLAGAQNVDDVEYWMKDLHS